MEKTLYSKHHIWVRMEGDKAFLGITDYAQEKLGSIMFVNLPDPGEELVRGERFGDIESIKTVSDLIAPVNGEVTGVNEELIDSPEDINGSPYESWLLEIGDISGTDELMDEEVYLKSRDDF